MSHPLIDWDAARRLVPQRPDKVNLNAGTLSPTPAPVLDAVTRLRAAQAAAPSDFAWRQAPGLLQRARLRLATYLGCRTQDLLLLPNVTYAINIVANSLRLPPGSEILTTDHEYGAMLFVWQRLAKRHDLRVRQFPLPYRAEDPDEIVEAFRRAVTAQTRVVFFSHCTTTTGLVLPAERITRAARERAGDDALVVIDGAHAPGMVQVDLSGTGADFYGANCHKWMMCPPGSGFLHAAPHRRAMLEPLVTSWGWEWERARPDDDSGWGGTFWQRDLEFHGTLDRTPQMAIPDALDFREQPLGGDNSIRARTRELVTHARHRLAGAGGIEPATPQHPDLSGSIVAFEYPCADVIAMRDRMWNEFGIECPVTQACGRTFLRVSCAWFNTTGDLDRLADALAAIRKD